MAKRILSSDFGRRKTNRCRIVRNLRRPTAFFVAVFGGLVSSLMFATESFARETVSNAFATTRVGDSSLLLTTCFVTLFLILTSIAVLAIDAEVKLQRSARWLLCGFHLFVAITFAFLAWDSLSAFFPVMFALTAESLLFAGQAVIDKAKIPPVALHSNASRENDAAASHDDRESESDIDRAMELRLIASVADDQCSAEDSQEGGDDELSESCLSSECVFSVQRHLSDKSETYSGQARVFFSAANESESVHIAFCPPFEQTPTAEVFQLAGSQAVIRTGMLEKFGMRIDLRASRNQLSKNPSANASFVDLEFVASATRNVSREQVA